MGSHHHKVEIKEERFSIPSNLQMLIYVLVGIGIIGALWAFFGGGHGEEGGHHGHPRFWANMLINNFYFLGLSLASVILIATGSVSNASWSVGFRRIPEAISNWLPISLVITLLIAFLGRHDIYHWAHEGITDPASPEYDHILASKSGYLNIYFMVGLTLVSYGVWIWITRVIRGYSRREDQEGGTYFMRRIKTISSVSLVFYAVSWAMMIWMYMMSVDAHWFSTMYWV